MEQAVPKTAVGDDDPSKGTQVEVRTVDSTVPEVSPSKLADLTAVEEYDRLFKVDEDAVQQPTTTRRELWSYYLYYNGLCGLAFLYTVSSYS